MQTTISEELCFSGLGLHSGERCCMRVKPAPASFGIRFQRMDKPVEIREVPSRWDFVKQTPLCTKIVNKFGVSVSTIEHILAALAGCGVHNANIEIDNLEVPILDGSARPFAMEILRIGIVNLEAPLSIMRIKNDVSFSLGKGWAKLEASNEPRMTFSIKFQDAAIGFQKKSISLSNGSFVKNLCDSRTFCSVDNVEAMRAEGLALGGSLDNAVVFDGESVLNPGGLRHKDEAVRHKMLDAIGDLSLIGQPLICHYIGNCAGHAITNGLIRKLFASPESYEIINCQDKVYKILPGVGATLAELPLVA